jgi:hypothetical protein
MFNHALPLKPTWSATTSFYYHAIVDETLNFSEFSEALDILPGVILMQT